MHYWPPVRLLVHRYQGHWVRRYQGRWVHDVGKHRRSWPLHRYQGRWVPRYQGRWGPVRLHSCSR